MTSKKRVYDLAKEYGMTGQDLAAKLREMGFAQVKSHMTALPEADLMLIEGRLDAYGYSRSGGDASAEPEPETGGLVIKRKKKRRKPGEEEEVAAPVAAEPESEPQPVASTERGESEAATQATATESAAPQTAADAGLHDDSDTVLVPARSASTPTPQVAETPSAPEQTVASVAATEPSVGEPAAAEATSKVAGAPESIDAAGEGPATVDTAGAEQSHETESAPARSDAATSHVASEDSIGVESTPSAAVESAAAESAAAESAAAESAAVESAAVESAGAEPASAGAGAPAAAASPDEAAAASPSAAATPAATTSASATPAASTPSAVPSAAPSDRVGAPAHSTGAAAGAQAPTAGQGAADRARPAAAAAAAKPEAGPADGGEAKPAAARAKTAAASGEVTPVKPAAGEDSDIVRPSSKRRQGKVVGFIDLSKLQTDKPVRRESRRHRSADDQPAPNVQPTFGKDRKRALSRSGDVQRGDLTAAQLREREAGRFLRRQRPQHGGAGRGRGGGRHHAGPSISPSRGGTVTVEHPLTIKKLGEVLSVKSNELLKTAFRMLGFGAVNINTNIDEDTAVLLAAEYEVDLEVTREIAAEEALLSQLDQKRQAIDEEDLVLRPPTVAIMGHVDHGKTTLIDSIRASRIADGESGGITQHIGAYQVETKAGHKVTVIDTPGHAAFTSMRARGASAVDIAILVVAADDGVKPQTEEAVNHAKAAGTPLIVAINKCDKPEANPDKVMNELSGLGLIPEEWGGTTAMLKISALKSEGIDELLERVFLEGELLDLRCHPTGPAAGVVLEAEVQQGRGIVAHLLIQDGSLEQGQVILAGEGYGKVRSIQDDRGKTIKSAGPATPVEVSGLDKLPGVGERFHVVPDLQDAKQVAEERAHSNRMVSLAERQAVSRENLFEAVAQADKSVVNLIVKGDVQGSVEVLKAQLAELVHDEVVVKVLHAGVGAIAESDVDLATTSDATIIAFHVGTNPKARQLAERGGVQIRNYNVIYEVLDDVRLMMEGELSPDISEQITGHVEIRRLFKSSRIGNIAGSYVLDGKIMRDSKVRLMRDSKVVWTGEIGTLRRESDDAKEVREGFECGIVLRNYNDIQEGDVIEAFRLVETKRKI
ncbi:translation initiation factor IF-2 [Engelhardtia mirabilis]|uniref:Translation initiation factor IF-2 n=1 Tax=Engelhardtia mirabilis TaxID=2528011 RepID=A0A518BMN3_9BACT|nr:Translation initiation factor IF-2 [Planctomycetes bacterium Pla133]QDV02576.1 Translation initiation factor IF-2 [Planctomycetes bacterium Pla86]